MLTTLLLAACLETCLPFDTVYFTGTKDCQVEASPDDYPVYLCKTGLEVDVRERVKPTRKGDYLDILTEASSRNEMFCHGKVFYSPGR
jgi:hypothetical protein